MSRLHEQQKSTRFLLSDRRSNNAEVLAEDDGLPEHPRLQLTNPKQGEASGAAPFRS
jgi:hypothetical protein